MKHANRKRFQAQSLFHYGIVAPFTVVQVDDRINILHQFRELGVPDWFLGSSPLLQPKTRER